MPHTPESPDTSPARRSFLARLASAAAALGVGTLPVPLAAAPTASRTVEDPWMARLAGTHRVVFHSHMPTEALALRWAQTYLDTQRASYGMTDADSGVVVGLNGRSIGWFFNDAMWAKYPTIADVMQAPGTKNPYTSMVAALAKRGVLLLACNNSIRASGQRFLPEAERGNEAARTAFADDVRANLLPGVEVVPSMVVTLQQAQERGCRYVYAGG